MDGNRLPAITERFDSNFKTCNQLPEGIFRKLFPRVTFVQLVFYMVIKGLFIYDLEHKFAWSFSEEKKSYSLKKQKHFILLKIPLKNTNLQFNKEIIEYLNCTIYLFQERFLLVFFLFLKRD